MMYKSSALLISWYLLGFFLITFSIEIVVGEEFDLNRAIASYSFLDPCWQRWSKRLSFANERIPHPADRNIDNYVGSDNVIEIHEKQNCPLYFTYTDPSPHTNCFSVLYPIMQFDPSSCDFTVVTQMINPHRMTEEQIFNIEFPVSNLLDGTFVNVITITNGTGCIMAAELAILDMNGYAQLRDYASLLPHLSPISFALTMLDFYKSRVLSPWLPASALLPPTMRPSTLPKVLIVRGPYQQSRLGLKKGNIACPLPESIFDRLYPFLSLHDKRLVSVEYFSPIPWNPDFDSCNHPSDVPIRDLTDISPTFDESNMLKVLMQREWFFSLDQLLSRNWNLHRTMKDSNVRKAIEDAIELVTFFNRYDIIIYDSVSWKFPHFASVYANLMWLANHTLLVRQISAADSAFSSYPDWSHADLYLADSQAYTDEFWYYLTVCPVPSVDIYCKPIILPPYFDLDDFGLDSGEYFPGVFIRMAAWIIQQCKLPPYRREVKCPRWELQFVMVGIGGLSETMKAMIKLHRLSAYFVFIESLSPKSFGNIVKNLDVVVDPSTTYSMHAHIYPLAAYFVVPIVKFVSATANEWLVSDQPLFNVELGSIQSLAFTCLQALNSLHVPKGTHNDSHAFNRTAKDREMQMFRSHVSAETITSLLLHVLEIKSPLLSRRMISSSGLHRESSRLSGARTLNVDFMDDTFAKSPLYATEGRLSISMDVGKEITLDFDPSQWHNAWLNGAPFALDTAVIQINSTVFEHCTLWDSYGVVGDMYPKLTLKLPSMNSFDEDRFLNDATSITPRILCIVYTIGRRSGQSHSQLRTWGKRCDGFIAFSDESNAVMNIVKLDMQYTRRGGDSYGNMWRKSQVMWRTVADRWIQPEHHLNGVASNVSGDYYDWVIVGGDDLYVSVPNLRDYLATLESGSQRPIYLGRQLLRGINFVYNDGGAGYVLNAQAVRVLNRQLSTPGKCFPDTRVSMEDVIVGMCLADAGILPLDTREIMDPQLPGRERFHWYTPKGEFEGTFSSYRRHAPYPIANGSNCCSRRSISFHPLTPTQMLCADLLWSL